MVPSYRELMKRLRTARLIGIGEALHATDSLHIEMCSFLKILIEERAIEIIFIENPIYDTAQLNSWLLGQASPTQRDVNQYLYRIWHTKPFRELLKWLRRHNLDAGERAVKLVGIDPRQVAVDVRTVFNHLDPKLKRSARSIHCFRHAENWRQIESKALDKDQRTLKQLRSDARKLKLFASRMPPKSRAIVKLELGRLNLWVNYLITSYSDFGRTEQMRDLAMTQSIVRAMPRRGRAAIIAHAGHLMNRSRNQQSIRTSFNQGILMGERLRSRFGTHYQSLLFTAHGLKIKTEAGEILHAKVTPRSVEAALLELNPVEYPIIANKKALLRLGDLTHPPTEICEFTAPTEARMTLQGGSLQGYKWGQTQLFDYVILTQRSPLHRR